MLTRVKPISCYILLLLICISSTACSRHEPPDEPQLNSNPKYYLTVKGHIDPALVKHIHLVWSVIYSTNNDQDTKCQDVVNYFEGAIFPLEKRFDWQIQPDEQGDYEIKIPLDKYVSGYCQWAPSATGYEYSFDNGVGGASVNIKLFTDKKISLNFYQDTWYCNNIDCDLIQHINSDKYIALELNSFDNYIYVVNIKQGKNK